MALSTDLVVPRQRNSREPYLRAAGIKSLLEDGLEDALSMLRADLGNVQIIDPVSGELRIAVQAGFSDEFVEYFGSVDNDGACCSRAAQQVAQTVIPDVTSDPAFAPHRAIAASSGFRAVQSTPLVDSHGHLVGMLSTHYPRPHRPSGHDLELIRRYGELLGQAIEATLEDDAEAAS
jgi:GAF domain-containing protein